MASTWPTTSRTTAAAAPASSRTSPIDRQYHRQRPGERDRGGADQQADRSRTTPSCRTPTTTRPGRSTSRSSGSTTIRPASASPGTSPTSARAQRQQLVPHRQGRADLDMSGNKIVPLGTTACLTPTSLAAAAPLAAEAEVAATAPDGGQRLGRRVPVRRAGKPGRGAGAGPRRGRKPRPARLMPAAPSTIRRAATRWRSPTAPRSRSTIWTICASSIGPRARCISARAGTTR